MTKTACVFSFGTEKSENRSSFNLLQSNAVLNSEKNLAVRFIFQHNSFLHKHGFAASGAMFFMYAQLFLCKNKITFQQIQLYLQFRILNDVLINRL